MISVALEYESETAVEKVKPLGVLWGKYPEYTAENTIHVKPEKYINSLVG